MKKILGLDLGTNSIGWALIEKFESDTEFKGKILGMGSRIIPMGSDKLDYEKGVGITKNAERRTARTIRKMNKRYKLRRNKLLFIMNELGILPDQFQFKNGIPQATRLQTLELLPIKKGTLQLNSLQHYELRVKSLTNEVSLKEFGKILYQFNQLRGYAGGNNEDDFKKKNEDNNDEETERKKYEVLTQKVVIIKVEKSDRTFKAKGGKNKGQDLPLFDITILLEDEELEGTTMLQSLEVGKEEELEIRIKRTKKGENITFALPQKTNWRKQMEATRDILTNEKLYIGQLLLRDLNQNRWGRIRNRVILRKFYQEEFDTIWNEQAKHHSILDNCPKEHLDKIVNYLYPGKSETQAMLRKDAMDGGLKYLIKEQVIYYQRPLKPQTELISNCQFETDKKVIANTHPLFQQFRCWKQINQLFIRSKVESYNEKKRKTIYKYYDKYLTTEEKESIFYKLQNQKQLGFSEVAKIVGLKNDRTEFLNGINVKAKLKGCDTIISIRKILGDDTFNEAINKDKELIQNIWEALFNNTGNEYDEKSPKVSAVIGVLQKIMNENVAIELGLRLAQNINLPRKYGSLSKEAINKILPLMVINSTEISDSVKERFEKIKYIIETGDITGEEFIEDYMIEYISYNPEILKTGGMMDSLAASLVYGKHTTGKITPTIKNYHDIKYDENRKLRNPVVEQLTNETMQVIKALWKQYKINSDNLEIRVELARDLKNSASEREKIYKGQITNQRINESVKKRLIELKQEPTQGNIDLYKLWSKQNTEEYPKQSKDPTMDEIQKLRIWEEQKCISPYTLKPIPLSKLFSSDRLYDIDHIVPKSRLFDDSVSNKIVCETDINEEKSNRTAWEYISQQNSKFAICTIEDYIEHVNTIFFGKKKKNLLLEKIPNNFVERQIKDTQFISVAVKNELARIVGSDNVKTTTGEVTNFLRSRWGLKKLFMEMTEQRFKQMELWDSSKQWVKKYYDQEKKKNVYEIENWSKRFDHRHHAIDALVVALTEQKHIQRLNNLNKELQDWVNEHKSENNIEVQEGEAILEAFFNLDEKRREEIQKQIEGFRKFDAPFDDLIKQAKEKLETTVVSHKLKDKLSIQINQKTKKKELKIRAALHEATFYGKLKGQDTKTISISNLSAKDIDKIIDKKKKPQDKDCLKEEIENHRKKFDSMKEAFTGEGLKAFNKDRMIKNKQPVYKLKIRYSAKENEESTLQRLYENNDKLSVKTGDNYLYLVMEKNLSKRVERYFDIIPLFDAAQIAKDELRNGNENFKQKICDDYRIKHKEKPDRVLFTLQQNDLVYLPENNDDPVLNLTKEEFKNWIQLKENNIHFNSRIYKVVKFSGNDCYFVPNNFANTISIAKDLSEEQLNKIKLNYGEKKIPKKELNYVEYGSYRDSSPFEYSVHFTKVMIDKKYKVKPRKIQEYCIKLKSDWIGNVLPDYLYK